MKSLPSINFLKKKYNLNNKDLIKIFHKCVHYYLSEEEFEKFVIEFYMIEEEKRNKKLQL